MNRIHKKKLITLLLILSILICIWIPGSTAASNSIKWLSYNDAKLLKQKNDSKVFLYFFSTNCYYCGLMEKNTFSNSKVTQYLNRNFTPIRVNSDTERDISRSYNIRGNPMNFFLTEKFEVIGKLPGYLPPGDLLNILRYIHTDSYTKMTLGDFLKKPNR